MKAMLRSFQMLLRQIAGDGMLIAVFAAPLLAGCMFRFGVPYAETLLCESFGKTAILADYYLMIDLFLAIMTPFLFCFVSSLVMLTEFDENISAYLTVTPIGRGGYVLSRLLFPAVISIAATAGILHFFTLTAWTWPNILLVGVLGALMSIPMSLLVVSFSHNRVEGMALGKLLSALLLGLPVPFFLANGAQYLFSPLPSFWIAKLFYSGSVWYAVPAIASSLVWVWVLYRKFSNKIA